MGEFLLARNSRFPGITQVKSRSVERTGPPFSSVHSNNRPRGVCAKASQHNPLLIRSARSKPPSMPRFFLISLATLACLMTTLSAQPMIKSVKTGQPVVIKGIAFDGGYGIREVLFSADGGQTWRETKLGKDLGKYSFREWQIPFTPDSTGALALKVKATNRIGQSQPLEPLWNPAGYMRNVVETVRVNSV